MEPSTYAVCQAAKWLKSSVERLSGKSERAPFRGPFSLHNGAKWHLFGRFALPKKVPFDSHNDFPDSLGRGILGSSQHLETHQQLPE